MPSSAFSLHIILLPISTLPGRPKYFHQSDILLNVMMAIVTTQQEAVVPSLQQAVKHVLTAMLPCIQPTYAMRGFQVGCCAGCRPMKSSLSKREASKAFAKMVVDSKSGRVLGVHFAGAEAAEIVQVFKPFDLKLVAQGQSC